MNIEETLRSIYCTKLDVSPQKVTSESTVSDLGGDSLDNIEILMDVEEKLDCHVDDDVWGDGKTSFAQRLAHLEKILA